MVLLMSGSQGNCLPIVDLDSLNADEVHELLEEHLTELDAKWPLIKRAKSKASNVRSKYVDFLLHLLTSCWRVSVWMSRKRRAHPSERLVKISV